METHIATTYRYFHILHQHLVHILHFYMKHSLCSNIQETDHFLIHDWRQKTIINTKSPYLSSNMVIYEVYIFK